jgi:hypothetical protein
MKKILLTVAVGLVVIFSAFSMGFPQVIKAPSPELAKEIAAFSGKWKGTWIGGVDFTLIVTEITAEKAEIVFATAGNDKIAAASDDITAKVILGNNPKIQFDRKVRVVRGFSDTAWYTFEMQKDLKTLKGVIEGAKMSGRATLERIE